MSVKLLMHFDNEAQLLATVTEPYFVTDDSVNNAIWAGNSDVTSHNVYRINRATRALEATIDTGYATSFKVAVDAGGFVWAVCAVANKIVKINPATNTVIAEVTVGTAPYYIHCVGNYVYVSCGYNDSVNNGVVSKVHRTNHTVDATITVGKAPHGMTDDGTYLYVCNEVSCSVSKINMSTDAVDATYLMGGTNVAVLPFWDAANNRLWVTGYGNNVVKVFDTAGTVLATISINNPMGIDSDGTDIIILSALDKNLYKYNKSTYALINSAGFTSAAGRGIAYSVDGFIVAGSSANQVEYVASINFSNEFKDSTGIYTPVINTGSPVISSAQFKWLTSLLLNGSSSLKITNYTDYLASNNFTISFWLYPTAATRNERILVWYQDNNNRGYIGINNTSLWIDFATGGSWVIDLSWAATILQNTWTHFEIGRSGNNWYGFVGGNLIGAALVNANAVPTYTNNNLYIGVDYYNSAPNQYSNGYLEELLIDVGTCLHTASFTPPTSPYTIPYSSGINPYYYQELLRRRAA